MKKENGYWIDENRNRWSVSCLCSEDQAQKLSKSLINCETCFNCSDCENCSGCSECHGCETCYECCFCENCRHCMDCSACKECFRCCEDCEETDKESNGIKIPKIDNIHSSVLSAINNGGCLYMSRWHHCETTHCRAGWVVHLAGKQAYALEKRTSTPFAAMLVYDESSEIKLSPNRFYDEHKEAMADIERCAELETASRGQS